MSSENPQGTLMLFFHNYHSFGSQKCCITAVFTAFRRNLKVFNLITWAIRLTKLWLCYKIFTWRCDEKYRRSLNVSGVTGWLLNYFENSYKPKRLNLSRGSFSGRIDLGSWETFIWWCKPVRTDLRGYNYNIKLWGKTKIPLLIRKNAHIQTKK